MKYIIWLSSHCEKIKGKEVIIIWDLNEKKNE